MIKIFTTTVLSTFLLFTLGYSQSKTQFSKSNSKAISNAESIEFRADTIILNPPSFEENCAQTVFTFTLNDNGGFLNGTNNFNDQAKAQRFDFDDASSYSVLGALVAFGELSVVGDGTIKVGVWDADSDGVPRDLIAESNPVSISLLSPNLEGDLVSDVFAFEEPGLIQSNQFFISVDFSNLYETNDMLSIWSTDENCGEASSTWELLLLEDQTTIWNPYDGSGITPNFMLAQDLIISAVVAFDNTTSTDNPFVKKNGLTLLPATPNPAKEQVSINFELDQPQYVQLELYSFDGRLIRKEDLGNLAAGTQSQSINIEDLTTGSYIYGLITEDTRLMSRIVVAEN